MRINYKNIAIRSIYFMIDLICIYFAIFLACVLRNKTLYFDVSLGNFLLNEYNTFRFIFIFWIMTTVLFLNANALYRTRREIWEGVEVWLVIKSVFWASLLVMAAIYTFKVHHFPRSIFIIGTGLIIVFLSVWRVLKRGLVEYMVARGYNNLNVLIIGAGRVGQTLAKEVAKKPGMGLKIVGFLDDFKVMDEKDPNVRILGKISNFVRIAKKEFVDKVFITIHYDEELFMKIIAQAKELGVSVRVVPQGFELISGEFSKYNIGIVPILEYSTDRPFRKQIGKRLFDFFVSLISLIFLLPVFIIIGIFIKVTSRGPIFYLSKRYGRGGRKFYMYKFRSMQIQADQLLGEIHHQNEVDGPIFKIKKDPRVTSVGKFLRRYSLDELPQFLNVLTGEMSLVGPRPLPVAQVEREDLKQIKRLEVRPGITGLWQIRGRSDLSFAKLVRWDMWYINNWSFWLDLNILLQTIPVVIKGKGAY